MLWCCDNDEERASRPKTVHIYLGYFFILNYCLGVGFLGVPYSFFYSGYLAAIPTLIVTGFLTWLTSVWLLEVMARAQALESYTKKKETGESEATSMTTNNERYPSSADSDNHYPTFEITLMRKFEILELSEIFVGKWFKYVYLILITIHGFLNCWSFASVAGSAWATNIPYNFGATSICSGDAFHHQILPLGGCLYSYYFSLFLFGLVVTTLSVLDLREQVVIQVALGLARYFTVGVIIIYCIVKLSLGGDACDEEHSLLLNLTAANETTTNFYNATQNISFKDIVVKFDPKGWIISIPVFVFAFMIHSGISSLTHPIRQKQYLHWMLIVNFSTALIGFMGLGVVVPLWFKASVQETVTLDWASFTRPGNSLQLRILSYFLILFPSLDVISAYPLTVHCVVNNIYVIITGNDTSKNPKWRFDWLLRLLLRLTAALVPLLAAFGVANLILVLKYAGLIGFCICFVFPTVLQLRSTFVCVKKFSTEVHLDLHTMGESRFASKLNGENTTTDSELNDEAGTQREKSPLLEEKPNKRRFYMTPYSNVVLSNPIFVGVMGAIEVCLFILAFASLFVQPHRVTCSTLHDEL